MSDRITVNRLGKGIVIDGNLRIRRIEHGMGWLPIVEVGDKYKTSYLADLLQANLDGDESSFSSILFGKARITIEQLGGDDGTGKATGAG